MDEEYEEQSRHPVTITLPAVGLDVPQAVDLETELSTRTHVSEIFYLTALTTAASLLHLSVPWHKIGGWRWMKVDDKLLKGRSVVEGKAADMESARKISHIAPSCDWTAWVWGTEANGGQFGMVAVVSSSW